MNLLEKASALLGIEWGWGASRQDGVNFRTNMVTLAEYDDYGAAGAGNVMGLSTAWACVNLLAGTIGSLPLMVYRTNSDGSRVLAREHPLYRILHDSPNADQTSSEFWEFMAACFELQGNGFCEVERRAGGAVTAMDVPVPPELVSVRRLSSGALQYEWTIDGRKTVLPEERVFHLRGFGGNPLGGLSTLSYGRNVFGLATAVERAAKSTFNNGVRPSGVLKFDNWLDPAKREVAREAVQNGYAGAMNSGRPLILEGGVTWQQLSINPEDAQMLESRRFSVEEICRFFGVPPHMVGHTENSTSWGTGLEQQTLGFQKFTLRRRLNRIEQALEKQLLTPTDRALGIMIEFNLEGLLRGDSAARSASYQSGLQNGYYTINEVRALENLPPVEGGDVPRMQMQNVPITEAGQQPALPAPGGDA